MGEHMGWAAQFYHSVLDLLAPPVCARCRVEGHWWCQPDRTTAWPKCLVCRNSFHPTARPTCQHPLPLLTVGSYHDADLRTALHQWKYDSLWQTSQSWAEILAEVARPFLTNGKMYLVPIPLHWRRQLSRGFNQSAVLASQIAGHGEVSVVHCLERVRQTSPQAKLVSHEQRLKNVTAAFRVNQVSAESLIGKKSIWLVDDVVTTGATIAAARRELTRAGLHVTGVLAVAATKDDSVTT